MNDRQQRIDGGALVGGLFCIGLGILFLLDQFRIAHLGHLIGTYWPMIVVMVGIPKLFRPRAVWGGLWIIAIGLWMQAVTLHLYDLTYSNSWPLLLICWGAGLVLRTFYESIARHRDGERAEGSHES